MMDLANYSANETLRDGRTVEIRSQRSQDRESMHAAIARSSSASLHRRFFAVRRQFSEKETDYFLDIDFVNHVALVVVANDGGELSVRAREKESPAALNGRIRARTAGKCGHCQTYGQDSDK